MKKIVSVFLCFLLFVGTVPLFSISSLAASYPTGYPNTHINTGDEIIDVVEIAKTQLGYKENSSGGSKYGAWRGNVNGGWCNFFVQWCLNEAGIGKIRFPYNNSSGYLDKSVWYSLAYGIQYHSDTKNYTPKKGDLFVTSGHIGIMIDSQNAIHGNSGAAGQGAVKKNTIAEIEKGFGKVKAYITPNYNSNNLKIVSCYTTMQTDEKNVKVRSQPYVTGKEVRKIASIGTSVNITGYFYNLHNHLWYQIDDGNWIYSERLSELPINTITYKQSKSTNQKKSKEKIVLPKPATVVEDRDYTIPAEIPVRDGYKFMGWALTEDAKKAEYQAGQIISADKMKEILKEKNGFSLYPVWKETDTKMTLDSYEISLNVSDTACSSAKVKAVCRGDLSNAVLNMTCISDNEAVASATTGNNFYEDWILFDKQSCDVNIVAKAPGTANIAVKLNDRNGKLLISKSIFVKVDASYSISYYDDTDGKIAKSQTKKYNKDIELLDYVPEKEGYIFLGWTTTAGSSTVEYGPGDKYEGNKDLTLYPVWKAKYEIKHEVNNGVLRIYGLGDMASYPTGRTPWASYSSQITEIRIESGVTSIGSNAFANFTNLTKVTMPYGITKIGAKAFYGCKNLASISIPASASIGNRAFANCSKLQEVTMPGAATQALSTQSVAEVSIGAFAFENCVSLASADIPDTVTDIGAGAFTGCTAMESFEIPESVEIINDSTFFGCSSLENINIPSGVTQIGDGAFSGCSSAETIVIPDTVDSIGDQAFSGCSVVTEVDIPENVDKIGAGVFTNCSALTNVDLPDNMEYIGEGMFSGCSALETVEIPQTVSYIGDGAFGYCSSLTGVEIPENVSEINNSTFYGCSSLQSFEVPATVVSIGDYAFGDCDNLKHVTISEGTASIGVGAFAFCDTLETVSLPASLTLIDDGAFMDCASLTNIDLLESELVIGEDAFYGCSSLDDIQLPEGIISIGDGAFDCCSADFNLSCFSTSSVYEQVVDTYDNVEVINPVSGVTLDKSDVELLVGQTLNLNATVAPANATCKDIIWSSNNPDYVSVDENGKVTALNGGRATITATTKDNAFVANCVVNSIVPVEGISLGYNEVEAYVDEEFTMYYTFVPENPTDIEVTWSSSNENVATVSEDGTVKILSEGTATITVTTNDGGFKDSCVIHATEYIEATGITIDETLELTVGESKMIQAQITPSNATSKEIFWLVEDVEIAEISDDGTVTAIKAGTTKIYAYAGSEEGPEAICTVTVNPEVRTVTWIVDGKGSTESIPVGNTIVKPESPEKEGYAFTGWTPDVPDTMPAKDLSFSATWKANIYNAVFNANGGVWSDGLSGKSVATEYGAEIIAPEVPVRDGYVFSGWSPDIGIMDNVNGKTFTAVWTVATDTIYTVETYTMNTSGEYEKASRTFNGFTGESAMAEYTVPTGFSINAEKSVLEGIIAVDSSLVLKVYLDRNTYIFTTVVDGVSTPTAYLYGAMVSKPVRPSKPDYKFIKWNGAIPEIMPAENVTVTAVFEKYYICPDCGNEILGEDAINEHIAAEEKAKITATIKIKNNSGSKTINYGETLKLTTIVTDMPADARIYWYVDGVKNGEGETFNVSFKSGTKMVEVKLVDANGNVIKNASGNEISDSENVSVNAGFFQKIISFFKNLFGANRTVAQAIYKSIF